MNFKKILGRYEIEVAPIESDTAIAIQIRLDGFILRELEMRESRHGGWLSTGQDIPYEHYSHILENELTHLLEYATKWVASHEANKITTMKILKDWIQR